MFAIAKKRIYWTEDQKQQILERAASLHLQNPRWNNLKLIREAQKVLENEFRRNLEMVSWTQAFKWFVDGLPAAIKNVSQKVEYEDEPPVPFAQNGKHTATQTLPDDIPTDMVGVLSTLVSAMKELKEETTKGLPIGIVGRLDDLQERLTKIETRFQQFMDQGLLFRLVPAGMVVQPVVQQEVNVAPAVPAQKPPEGPRKETRRPKVVVLNTDSGHVRHGIELGTRGHVLSVKFQDVNGIVTPKFDEFDYVLAYKKTPIPWIQAAKKFYPSGKFKAVSGGAVNMAEAIKALPSIEITD